MSVNYRTMIMRGWKMTTDQKKRFNELTGYEYENNFTRPNYYIDEDDEYNPVFFGDSIETFDTGDYIDVQSYHDDGLHPGLVFLEDGICDKSQILFLTLIALGATDIAEIFSESPKMYIISQVT